MRTGARLGIDWGQVRIGVAASDTGGMLAFPVETVAAGAGAVARLAELAEEYQVIEIVVGLPRSLSGSMGPAAVRIRAQAGELARALAPIPVRLIDERLSTVEAAKVLRERGRTARQQRSVIDQAAAVTILSGALESERASGSPPGEELSAP